MGRSEVNAEVKLGDVGRILVRRWRTVLASVLVMTCLGGLAFAAVPAQYSATTTLVVSPLANDPSESVSARDAINIATEREIVLSAEVARLALESVGRDGDDTEALISQMSVVAPDSSQVLRVTVSDGSPSGAAELSNAVADAYLEFRRLGGEEMAARFMEQIDARVEELSEAEDDTSREQIRELVDQRGSLALFGQDPGRVIGRASPPQGSSGPGLIIFVLAGLAGGALLGLALALVRERADPRLRSADRFSETVGSDVIVFDDPSQSEPLRWLRRTVASFVPGGGTVLLLSSATSGVDLVDRFAEVARGAGHQVDVMDASALSPAQIDTWVCSDRPGQETLVTGASSRGTTLVLVDATRVTSRTSVSELAAQADVAVLLVVPRDRVVSIRELCSIVVDAGARLVPVMVKRVDRRHGGEPR